MTRYAKFFLALTAAVGSAVATTADKEFSLNDGFVCAAAFLGALAVYVVPNKAN